jgi:hypothetical protein
LSAVKHRINDLGVKVAKLPHNSDWTPINRGTEAIRAEVAQRLGIAPHQCIRGDLLVTARVRTNEVLRAEYDRKAPK